MKLVRIREAKPLDNYRVGSVFEGLRSDEKRFREMRVEGATIAWPNGAGLCPDVLIWGGLPPADAASDAA